MQKRLSKQEVEFIKKRLQKKQAAFCGYLVSTGDPVTAARRAGFEKNPEQAAEELLCCATVLEEVQRLTEQREKTFAKLASAGYRRLAFGSIADAVSLLFTEQPTLRQLQEMDFPGETKQSGDMMRLLDAIMECGLKNDALLETFYEVLAEQQPKGRPFAVFLFHGIYDIPRKGTDKAEQWESEEVYEYMVCCVLPVHGDYETGEPFCGFLYPSFKDRSTDIFHIALFEKDPGVSGEGLLRTLGCERDE